MNRLTRSRVKRQPTRRRILRLLQAQGGRGATQIARRIGVTKTTVDFHLRVLAENKLVLRRTHARRTVWFPTSTKGLRRKALVALLSWRQRQIAHAILQTPGSIQKELTHRLRVSRKVFRQNMNALVEQGWVKEAIDARSRRYHPTRRLHASADLVGDLVGRV